MSRLWGVRRCATDGRLRVSAGKPHWSCRGRSSISSWLCRRRRCARSSSCDVPEAASCRAGRAWHSIPSPIHTEEQGAWSPLSSASDTECSESRTEPAMLCMFPGRSSGSRVRVVRSKVVVLTDILWASISIAGSSATVPGQSGRYPVGFRDLLTRELARPSH